MKLQDKNDGICAAELSAIPMEGPEVETSRGRDLKIYPKKYGGTRAGKGSVIIQRGTLGGWQWPVQRFDLLHSQDDDSDSSTEASSEDSSTSEDSSSDGPTGSNSFQEDYSLEEAKQPTEKKPMSNLPLPFMNFAPKGDETP